MSQIGKYLLLALLIANLASQYIIFNPISNIVFYGTLGVAVLYSIMYCHQFFHKDSLKATSFLWLFILVHTVYQFTFGINYFGKESLSYLLAKNTVLVVIYWGIITNYEFYYRKIIPFFTGVIPILIIYGFLFHNEVFAGRSTCGFGNPNSTSAISSIGFAGFLLLEYKPKWLSLLGAIVCMFGVLAGGSRAATVVCIVAVFLKYEFSWKTILLSCACLSVALFLFPYLGFKLNGIDRVVDVFSNGNFVGSREQVRKATMLMINENPILGWGFKTGIQGSAAKISQMGSHNGYLDIIKAIGYPYAILLLGGVMTIFFRMKEVVKSKCPFVRFHLFVVISILLAALYESYIIGVNQIMTNLLFVSIAVLQYHSYYKIGDEREEAD